MGGMLSRMTASTRNLWDSYRYSDKALYPEQPEFRSNFMGPGAPTPADDPFFEARTWDYNTYRNTSNSQDLRRKGITNTQLRNFADNCEILRSIIEKCKDQLAVLRWDFQLKTHLNWGKTPEQVRDESIKNPDIKKCRDFFKKPDGEHRFPEWLRIIVEEILVIDMLAVHKRKNMLGEPLWLVPLDADTIIKKVNKEGRIPKPPAIAYQQKIHGIITKDFTRDELFVYHRNPRIHKFYGYSCVEQGIQIIETALNRSSFQASYYTEGNIPDMLMRVSAEWTDEQIAKYQKYFDLLLSGDFAKRRKIRFIPESLDPIEPQKDALKDDFDEWIARVFCHIFSVSPNGFIKNLNRAIGEASREQSDEEGMFARMATIKQLVDTFIEEDLGIQDVEFVWLQNKTVDSKTQTEIDVMDVESGLRSIDEVRDSRGLPPIGMGNAVKTAHGYVVLIDDEEDHIEEAATKITQIDGDIPTGDSPASTKESTKTVTTKKPVQKK